MDQWDRAKTILLEALDRDPAEREEFLKDACADDDDLRVRIQAMLEIEEQAEGFLESPAIADLEQGEAPVSPEGSLPERIGQYRITRLIATGGMGAVYEARQERPRRVVALKLIREGFTSRSVIRRFEYEAQILGRLRHPGICQIYEAGVHFDRSIREGGKGAPYFVMEYVPNARPISVYVQEGRLTIRERLQLFARVCDAVSHGHQKGIIHRDLKPTNILVDSSGQPKVIDFGVARSTDSDMAITTMQTDVGELVGTVQYMSPEQCNADPHDLDTRSDVYALGVVLYEILCGALPYNLSGATIYEATRVIKESTPARLSSMDRTLRGDIETIARKALEKDRNRRYQSAAELGQDIERYLNREPIEARPPSMTYRARMFTRRHKIPVTAAALMILSMIIAIISTSWGLLEANAARREEAQRAEELKTVTEFQQSMLTEIDPARFGQTIVDDQRRRLAEGLKAGGASPEAIDVALRSFDRQMSQINATSLAQHILDVEVLSRAVTTIESRFADQPVLRTSLQQSVADTYFHLGLSDQALELQASTLAIQTEHLGMEDAATLMSINNMGALNRILGHLDEAERYSRRALDESRRVLGEDHPTTRTSLNNMASWLVSAGHYEEAESLYREIVEYNQRVYGESHPETLKSMSNLGNVFMQLGRYDEAEAQYREALEDRRNAQGEIHPDALVTLNLLASVLQKTGRNEEAEPLVREVLDRRRALLGDNHPKTLISINNLGFLLRSLGRNDEAEPYLKEAIERSRRVRGDNHPYTLVAIGNMGSLLESMERFDEAEACHRETLEGLRTILDDQHPTTLTALQNLATTLRRAGRYEEAEPYQREALNGRRDALGDDHPSTIKSMTAAGKLYAAMTRFDDAEPLLQEALQRARRSEGENHRNTLAAMRNLAAMYQSAERFTEGERILVEAYEIGRTALGADHEDTKQTVRSLIDLYEAAHEADSGADWDRKADGWRERAPASSSETNDGDG